MYIWDYLNTEYFALDTFSDNLIVGAYPFV